MAERCHPGSGDFVEDGWAVEVFEGAVVVAAGVEAADGAVAAVRAGALAVEAVGGDVDAAVEESGGQVGELGAAVGEEGGHLVGGEEAAASAVVWGAILIYIDTEVFGAAGGGDGGVEGGGPIAVDEADGLAGFVGGGG